ncbi:translocation/assembly module TamB domain-containing protein, partial [Salmonella enterica]|uniref:translocation/assembly module TamB domain-containing protein n=1 Tax=Salmonella enterica TaxID=28901 RepID=UPI0005E321ED
CRSVYENIYLMAAPPNIKVDCFGNQSFAAAWKENQLGDGNVLVLFPSLAAVQDAIQLGFDVTRIQVGGLGGGPNRKAVFQNITLDEKQAIRNPDATEDDVIAGVRVTGTADEPKAEIFSDPAMPQAEALSYLLRGQGLDSNQSDSAAMTSML